MSRTPLMLLAAVVALGLPQLSEAAFGVFTPQNVGILTGCDDSTKAFLSSFCGNDDFSEACQQVAGQDLFNIDDGICPRVIRALTQAARQLNSNAPGMVCTPANPYQGVFITFRENETSIAVRTTSALNTAVSGGGGFDANNVDCAESTTPSPTTLRPTQSPVTRNPTPAPVPTVQPTASPSGVQLCRGNPDGAICTRCVVRCVTFRCAESFVPTPVLPTFRWYTLNLCCTQEVQS